MTAGSIDDLVEHRETIANGVRLHYAAAGPADGERVVFLHGFPECWYTWRRQLRALADAGYRVVAPDLRGYNRSEKPRGVAAYRLETLVADVATLLEGPAENGSASAHLVAHDWGGMIAWATALERPARLDRLVVLNAPHPMKYARELTLEQAVRSWYALWFQLPWLPEALLSARNYRAIEDLFREGPERPGAFTEADVERLTAAIARPGALTAAINYYRAFLRGPVREQLPGSIPIVGDRLVDPVDPIEVPTLVLWGERDSALSTAQLEGLERYVADCEIERFPGAGHWIHADRPDRVSESIERFLDSRT